MSMSNKQQHLSDAELAKSILLGVAALSVACVSLWMLLFTLSLIK
jgi:hypothetical protein